MAYNIERFGNVKGYFMKKYDKRKKIRKTLYIDEHIVKEIERKAKTLRRKFNSLAVEQLEFANTIFKEPPCQS